MWLFLRGWLLIKSPLTASTWDVSELKIRRRRDSTTADLVEGAWGEVAVAMARKIALRKLARRRVVVAPFREFLLTSFDDGDISEDEFLLLYDINRSKNPDFPYQNYEHFDLERLDEKMSDIIHWTSI